MNGLKLKIAIDHVVILSICFLGLEVFQAITSEVISFNEIKYRLRAKVDRHCQWRYKNFNTNVRMPMGNKYIGKENEI